MIQKFDVQTDSMETLWQYLDIALRTVLDGDGSAIAVKIVNRRNKNYPLHLPPLPDESFPVILIQGWYRQKRGEKPYGYFNGYRSWMIFHRRDQVITFTRMTLREREKRWAKQFLKKHGDGYNDGFNRYDGTVSVGYELRSCNCSPEILAISPIHFYYGK